jgi:cellulose synthase/poly-beta-1,6-N-acetylglucosamine synthase-like glycosyltransferase
MIIWYIIFWLSLFLVLHSYLLYPWLLKVLSANRSENSLFFDEAELPAVTVLMSVFNEEKVLAGKLDSVLNSDYPAGKLTVIVGSDASTDGTNRLLRSYEEKYPSVHAKIFNTRQGKPAVINSLVEEVTDALIIMTDAKVIFHQGTIRTLIRHFKNEEIGIVGGNILNETVAKDGVSMQEKAFMSREITMKHREGLIWGSAIGAYGAIYAIRKNLYTPVPKGFAVDDFFITLNVLRKKRRAILDIRAITWLDVPNRLSEEYRRKVRIATGNYRNMGYFARELLTPWRGASFAYISHKVIRWLGPFIFIFFLLSSIMLFSINAFHICVLYTSIAILTLPIIDFFLGKIGIHVVLLRFVRHFVTMNIALLHGFVNYTGGIKRDVWQPTNR